MISNIIIEPIRLNLGCGNRPLKGYINIDYVHQQDVEIFLSHDLNKGLPMFDDNSVDHIYSSHSLEHIENLWFLVQEIIRVCKNGATVHIKVPHFTSDVYEFHKSRWRYDFFCDFTKRGEKYSMPKVYSARHIDKGYFSVYSKRLNFAFPYNIMNIINLHPVLCKIWEYSFLRSIFFCKEIEWKARVVKDV